MKILLISPVKSFEEENWVFPTPCAPEIIKGLTPSEHQVKSVIEEFEEINLDQECDLVGISCMTANAPRAYYLAEKFRKRKRKVVLGGIHPSILPEEAIQHADSVVIGEAEGVWEQLLQDHMRGKLQKYYHCPSPSLERYINKKHEKARGLIKLQTFLTTKGCPYRCPFCTVSNIYGEKLRHVPIEHIVKDIIEIKKVGNNILFFLDDNIVGDAIYAKKLFRAIKPFKIKWVGQSSISISDDNELLKLAKESGCVSLLVGIESISKNQIESLKKSPKNIEKIEECIKKIRDCGIFLYPFFVFGFDSDAKTIFEETYKFVLRNKITMGQFHVLTPYPGTKIFEQFKDEGRLLTTNWKYYDHNTVVFQPKNMTPLELQQGVLWIAREVSKPSIVIQRCIENIRNPILVFAILNWHIEGRKWINAGGVKKLERIKSGKYNW